MRRPIALLGLLAFANLVFAQSSVACSQSGERSHGTQSVAPSPEHAGHEGHSMPSTTAHEAVQEDPADDTPHAADCLMMGPCVLMLDVGRAAISATAAVPIVRVVAVSDNRPASLTTSPDIPPPRA